MEHIHTHTFAYTYPVPFNQVFVLLMRWMQHHDNYLICKFIVFVMNESLTLWQVTDVVRDIVD